MKKILVILLSITFLSLFTFAAMADPALEAAAMIEPDTEHNAVLFRIPKEWELVSENESIIDELTPGEEDGDSFVKMFSPYDENTEGEGKIAFGPNPAQKDGTYTASFTVEKGGKLNYNGLTLHNGAQNNPYAGISDDGTKLTVQLEGNATTGYEWTWYPSNSGVLELIDESYEPEAVPEGFVGGGGVYTFVFSISENPVGNTDQLLFQYERSFEENSNCQQLIVSVSVTEGRIISDLESDMTVLP